MGLDMSIGQPKYLINIITKNLDVTTQFNRWRFYTKVKILKETWSNFFL